jgi:beta-lactamase regulating signal transducer with metallopeptidase domain
MSSTLLLSTLLLSTVLRATLLFGLAFAVAALLARRSAADRRLVFLLALSSSIGLLVVALGLPGRPMAHVMPVEGAGRIVAEALSSAPSLAGPSPPRSATGELTGASAGALPLFGIWLAGVLLGLARLGHGVLRVHGVVRRATPLRPGISLSREIAGPLVAGYFRPCVLLPLEAHDWSEERHRLVLTHELAHVRRRDGLALLVGELSRALYWFHPLAWLSLAGLRRESELAADEDVIAGGARASVYAEHLLAVARTLVPLKGGVAMAGRPSELSKRIELLVSRERLPARPSARTTLSICVLAALLAGFVACADGARPPASSTAARSSAPTHAGVQTIIEKEAERARAEWRASRIAIVVLDPHSGELRGLFDDAAGRPIRPASTLKPLTIALALDAGRITPEQRFDCGNGQRHYGAETLRDANPYGLLSVSEIVAVSSNVGTSRVFDALGGAGLRDGLVRFGLEVPNDIDEGTLAGATVAIGHRVRTTPLALAAAYAALANGGLRPSPGEREERLIAAETAASLRAMLESAVSGERATGKAAQIPGLRVAGKTGTSDGEQVLVASFAGFLPAEAPRFVIYVGIETTDRRASGATAAAPLFARIGGQLQSL